MKTSRYLTAQEAAMTLGISRATLYAYVSRGLIRSETIGENRRVSRYNAEDVQKLRARKEQRKNPTASVKNALHWGVPLLESALTLITDEGLYYRGYDALELATTHTIEQAAALFWTGSMQNTDRLFNGQSAQPLIEKVLHDLNRLEADLSIVQRLHIALSLAGAADLAAYDFHEEKVAQAGVRILRLSVAVMTGEASGALPIPHVLIAGWQQTNVHADQLLNAALILCADHELNVSSFTARVVASAQAHLYSVVMAGLAALQGLLHGGNVGRAEALLREAETRQRPDQLIAERLRLGEMIPGFGHPLYPDGDPRAVLLLRLIAQAYPDAPTVTLANAIVQKMREAVDLAPNIDFALAMLARTLMLPPGTALAIFALGRTVGWIGHAIEQYQQGQMIRPRATYTGVPIMPKP